MDLVALRAEYDSVKPDIDRFRKSFEEQLLAVLQQKSLHPAIPIETRTKEWSSIVEKIDRQELELSSITQIYDLVGLRVVFLFAAEATRTRKMLSEEYKVSWQQDTRERLSYREFGYQSVHLIVRVRKNWLAVPTLREFAGFQAEIQIRTLSQHNWAVASRLLQYHQEQDVPLPVQRSLFRVAALMEFVDLELERVAKERTRYQRRIQRRTYKPALDQPLNVDLLRRLLDTRIPDTHKEEQENYVVLLQDLIKYNIKTAQQLDELIYKHLSDALKNDRTAFAAAESGDRAYVANPALITRGVFYSRVGLIQNMLHMLHGRA